MKELPHPLQPIVRDPSGIYRFKPNAIVRFLLDAGPYDLNKIAMMPFADEDREQLAQLIGYSVDGFCDLSYASHRRCRNAKAQVAGMEHLRRSRGDE